MEDEQTVDEIIAVVGQIMQAAGVDWTLQFLQAGLEEAANAGGEQPEPEMSQGGPPPMPGGPQMGGMRPPPPPSFKR